MLLYSRFAAARRLCGCGTAFRVRDWRERSAAGNNCPTSRRGTSTDCRAAPQRRHRGLRPRECWQHPDGQGARQYRSPRQRRVSAQLWLCGRASLRHRRLRSPWAGRAARRRCACGRGSVSRAGRDRFARLICRKRGSCGGRRRCHSRCAARFYRCRQPRKNPARQTTGRVPRFCRDGSGSLILEGGPSWKL